ncbi:hypothetical protein BDV59DRAFT_181750 [Aspergillus ambiguus]|uniref:uncharacterized protein n=1 Tax=Aspergillus ambiguus TaxID=176160 RepID=UPI003CCCCCAF
MIGVLEVLHGILFILSVCLLMHSMLGLIGQCCTSDKLAIEGYSNGQARQENQT